MQVYREAQNDIYQPEDAEGEKSACEQGIRGDQTNGKRVIKNGERDKGQKPNVDFPEAYVQNTSGLGRRTDKAGPYITQPENMGIMLITRSETL